MKKFLTYFVLLLLGFVVLLEISTRVFKLSGATIPETNLKGDKLLLPGSEGFWIRGGLGELTNHYKINNQGFNSIKDYDHQVANKIKIAIIGDSYIEGFHVDVENSIGRLLEKKLSNKVEVHEYGCSGGNIVDFSLIFKKWVKNNYDFVFILLTNKDLASKSPSFMNKGNKISKTSLVRDIYNKFYFIRYLNINHGLSVKVNKIFSFDNFKLGKEEEDIDFLKVNFEAFESFNDSVVILYESNRLNTSLLSKTGLNMLMVEHELMPIDCGFDGHWSLNGRKNASNTIFQFLIKTEMFDSSN